MNCKIIFFDIDGTLVNSKKEVTPAVKSAIYQAMDKGIKIAIASGRPFHGILPYINELNLKETGGYVLSFNGGKIIDCKTNDVIYDVSLPFDTIKKAYELSKKFNLNIITYDGDTIITENTDDKYLEIESRINDMPAVKVDCLLDSIKDKPVKCLILGEPDILKDAETVVRDELKDSATVFRSEPFFLEIMPKGIDKATSISEFIKKLDIKQEETMAFGDGFNDITMIEYVNTGVAMKNGCAEILKKADYITEFSNDDDGVAEFLKKYVL
jgi:hypothetical protein